MRSNLWKITIGIAAMITVLFGSYYLINSLTTPALEPITVFTADTTPQHIVLQKDDGEKVVLDEPQSNNQVLPKTAIAKSEKKSWIIGKSSQQLHRHMYLPYHEVKVSKWYYVTAQKSG